MQSSGSSVMTVVQKALALDEAFLISLPLHLQTELLQRRQNFSVETSEFLLKLAPFVDSFFGSEYIKPENIEKILDFKKNYLQRYILHHKSVKDLEGVNLEELKKNQDILNHPLMEKYCIWAIHTKEGREANAKNPLFHLPQKIDPDQPLTIPENLLPFQGFDLRDHGMNDLQASIEAHYCLICHKREKDTCRKACPLDQKISEMILAYRQGHLLGALAIAMVDNPMILATGHRICYDCSAGCIFKNQTPVDVPGIESLIVKTAPFEVIQTLSFWNPLKNFPFPSTPHGYKVLVVGAGPAGFTLSLMLLQRGYEVVLIDALKSFGGVMEYGITPRWDKTNLTKIQDLLESFPLFSFLPSVHFGQMLTIDEALEMGFDQVALCVGAAKPKFIGVEDLPFKGVHMSNDFLMGLKYGFDLRFPVVVIGAGLSGVDTAVEALMYGKNRDVSLLYRKPITQSPSVRQNIKEIQEAVSLGVKILDQREILEIRGGERVEKIVVRHQETIEVIPVSTLLIAAGTESTGQMKHSRISYFGDANPQFRGSVVQAIASVKEGMKDFEKLIQTRPPLMRSLIFFSSKIESIQEISGSLEIKIKNPLIAHKAKIGQYIKLDHADVKPIPLRIGRIEGEYFYVYLYKILPLEVGENISIVGPLGVEIELPEKKICYVPESDFSNDFYTVLTQELLKNNNQVFHQAQENSDFIFDWAFDETDQIKTHVNLQTTKASFMCMMQGLCGRCLTHTVQDGKKKLIFGCTQGIAYKDFTMV